MEWSQLPDGWMAEEPWGLSPPSHQPRLLIWCSFGLTSRPDPPLSRKHTSHPCLGEIPTTCVHLGGRGGGGRGVKSYLLMLSFQFFSNNLRLFHLRGVFSAAFYLLAPPPTPPFPTYLCPVCCRHVWAILGWTPHWGDKHTKPGFGVLQSPVSPQPPDKRTGCSSGIPAPQDL